MEEVEIAYDEASFDYTEAEEAYADADIAEQELRSELETLEGAE
jgi:hypothetical protein